MRPKQQIDNRNGAMEQTDRWAVAIVAGVVAVMTCTLIASSSSLTYGTVAANGISAQLIVNATDDIDDGFCGSVHCSLREAILAANEREGPDNIVFDTLVFPPQEPGVIELTAMLPGIYDGYTTIDASDAGVIVDGTSLDGTDAHGFFITSSGNTLRGIRLQSIPGVGVVIGDFESNGVYDNTIDGVTVVDSGYGSPDLGGRADGMWILAYCQGCIANRNKIINCVIENGADDGIEVWSEAGGVANDNLIIGNTVRNVAEVGIEIDVHGPGGSVNQNTVANNLVEDTREQAGIVINAWRGGSANGNIVSSNVIIENAEYGIGILTGGPGTTASANSIVNNLVEHHRGEGIWLSFADEAVSDGNFIIGNTIKNHDQAGEGTGIGVYSNDNLIYHNNFINNFFSATDNGHNNCWDHDGEGNYWSDYTGRDENGDGIGDTPYPIAPNGVDNYPLMTPYTYNRIYLPVLLRNYP